MKDAKSLPKPKNPRGDSPGLRVVGIDFNPGPDAQERLRRLFTLLVKYAVREGSAAPERGSSPEDPTGGKA